MAVVARALGKAYDFTGYVIIAVVAVAVLWFFFLAGHPSDSADCSSNAQSGASACPPAAPSLP